VEEAITVFHTGDGCVALKDSCERLGGLGTGFPESGSKEVELSRQSSAQVVLYEHSLGQHHQVIAGQLNAAWSVERVSVGNSYRGQPVVRVSPGRVRGGSVGARDGPTGVLTGASNLSDEGHAIEGQGLVGDLTHCDVRNPGEGAEGAGDVWGERGGDARRYVEDNASALSGPTKEHISHRPVVQLPTPGVTSERHAEGVAPRALKLSLKRLTNRFALGAGGIAKDLSELRELQLLKVGFGEELETTVAVEEGAVKLGVKRQQAAVAGAIARVEAAQEHLAGSTEQGPQVVLGLNYVTSPAGRRVKQEDGLTPSATRHARGLHREAQLTDVDPELLGECLAEGDGDRGGHGLVDVDLGMLKLELKDIGASLGTER
tara:strand:+ start:124 stop:1248 length:1125 start_codon:yes stop_codon:yes gene_type:complete